MSECHIFKEAFERILTARHLKTDVPANHLKGKKWCLWEMSFSHSLSGLGTVRELFPNIDNSLKGTKKKKNPHLFSELLGN